MKLIISQKVEIVHDKLQHFSFCSSKSKEISDKRFYFLKVYLKIIFLRVCKYLFLLLWTAVTAHSKIFFTQQESPEDVSKNPSALMSIASFSPSVFETTLVHFLTYFSCFKSLWVATKKTGIFFLMVLCISGIHRLRIRSKDCLSMALKQRMMTSLSL